jgi:predicted DNA-binding protein
VNETKPSPAIVRRMEQHLIEEEQQYDFELARDAVWEGNEPERPLVLYLPEAGARPPGFRCLLCDQLIYGQPSFGHPERNRALRLHEPALRPLLKDVYLPEEQEAVIEDYDRGRLAEANLERIRKGKAMATRRPKSPEVARRTRACQEFMLAHYAEYADKGRAIEALIALAQSDPDRHLEIVGRSYPFARDTYNAYWHKIPLARRREAKEQGLARHAEQKRAKAAQPRRELTP